VEPNEPDPREDVAGNIADGAPVPWEEVQRKGAISPEEIEALRALEAIARNPADEDDNGLETQMTDSGGFDVGEPLGSGTYGKVFRAIDRNLGRTVALKKLKPRDADPDAWKRFLNEARALAQVEHPNIIKIHSVDPRDGELWIVLEFIEGLTLEKTVQERGSLAPEEAAHIGIALCRALAAIHAKGLVHLDVKPTNVMRAKGGAIKLLDFGFTRSAATMPAGGSVGTPITMSPEQFAIGAKVDARADLYAVGVLLYFLASGRYPYEAEDVVELREQVLSGKRVLLTNLRPEIPGAFAAIVERCLSRDPNQRYASAGELEKSLLAFLGTEPTRPPAAPRGRRGLLVASVPILALAGWIAWSAISRPPEYELEASFLALRDDRPQRLGLWDDVHVAEKLVMEAKASRPLHVYVLNYDATGEPHVLFPLKGFETQNPLAPGKTHRLPGLSEGVEQSWKISTAGGGRETFLVVVSPESDSDMEALVRAVPAAGQVYPKVNAGQLRGINESLQTTRGVNEIATVSASGPPLTARGALLETLRAIEAKCPALPTGKTRATGNAAWVLHLTNRG
jgi:eukaryotic-like serine/threonine-protein kinase